ncbi:hypothetical protein ACJJTC_007696 [Scirpophaga incertulas]
MTPILPEITIRANFGMYRLLYPWPYRNRYGSGKARREPRVSVRATTFSSARPLVTQTAQPTMSERLTASDTNAGPSQNSRHAPCPQTQTEQHFLLHVIFGSSHKLAPRECA